MGGSNTKNRVHTRLYATCFNAETNMNMPEIHFVMPSAEDVAAFVLACVIFYVFYMFHIHFFVWISKNVCQACCCMRKKLKERSAAKEQAALPGRIAALEAGQANAKEGAE